MRPDHRTAVMGILNITPDSFSDGGRFDSSETAFRAAKRMAAQGADLIDLGAQSTRPGASDVGAEIELERLLPVLRRLQQARRDGDLPAGCCSQRHLPCAGGRGLPRCWGRLDQRCLWWPWRSADVAAGSRARLPLCADAPARGCPHDEQPGPLQRCGGRGGSRAAATLRAGPTSRCSTPADRAGSRHWLCQNHPAQPGADAWVASPASPWLPPAGGHLTQALHRRGVERTQTRARLWGTAATVCQAVAAGTAVVRVHDVGPIVQTCRMAEALFKPNAANRAPQTPA